MELSFQIVVRKGAGQFRVLVFDRMKHLHFPLTVFAAEAVKRSSDSTARVYLNAVIPFFEWLEKDESQGGAGRSWDDSPEAIRQGVGDYLVERLKCKVREHYAGFQLVSLTDGTQTTVRVFLSALKLFYRVMRAQDLYRHANALVDGPSAVLAEVQDRIAGGDSLPRMPEVSGVVHPRKQRLSDSYFKLVGETWIPQVIDDPEFPARVLSGGQSVGWHLQEQCIARILFESGCRVSEAVGLSFATGPRGVYFRRRRHSTRGAMAGGSSSSVFPLQPPSCYGAGSTRNAVSSIATTICWMITSKVRRTTRTSITCRSSCVAAERS